MKTKVTCMSCAGSGKWTAPSIKLLNGNRLSEKEIQCLSCEGTGVLVRHHEPETIE